MGFSSRFFIGSWVFKGPFLWLLCLSIVSCQTVTVKPGGGKSVYSFAPQYESSQHFFLWGLVGESFIDIASICKNRKARQMQTQRAFSNGLVEVLTLGVYSPRTVKIWCGPRAKAKKRAKL